MCRGSIREPGWWLRDLKFHSKNLIPWVLEFIFLVKVCTNFDTQIFILRVFNPIPPGLWNDVVTWVFLTRSTFQPYNLVKSHATIKNLFPDKIFDIQTSFGTTISTVKEV